MSGPQQSCAVACPGQQTQTLTVHYTQEICGELEKEFGREEGAMVGLSSLPLRGDTSPGCVHYL